MGNTIKLNWSLPAAAERHCFVTHRLIIVCHAKWLPVRSGLNISAFLAQDKAFSYFLKSLCVLLLFIEILVYSLSIYYMFQKKKIRLKKGTLLAANGKVRTCRWSVRATRLVSNERVEFT